MMSTFNLPYQVTKSLIHYRNLLLKWNKKVNLISQNSEKEVWKRHILDSLQLSQYIHPLDTTLDFGSGGGLPGIVLSIIGIKNVILVEANKRKSIFLIHASITSTNRITVIRKRMDSKFLISCDVLTSRATSGINNILTLTQGVEVRKKLLLLKGKRYEKEIEDARKYWLFDLNLYPSITSEEGKILEISNIKKIKNYSRE